MRTLVQGVHHVTLCPAGAQEDLDFFVRVLGQRIVKQTVLMDGRIPIYHFYYGNGDADIGSIATCFPYGRKAGQTGSGQVSVTSYTVPTGAVAFWKEHCERHCALLGGIEERFGARYVRVRHPAGLIFEMVEDDTDRRRPWTTNEVSGDVATRGFLGAVMSVREIDEQERFFVEALGLRKVGVDGAYHRFAIGSGGAGCTLDLHHEPDRAPGSWAFGAGTAHHIALNLESDEALLEQKSIYEELGFTDASEVKDRFYFHSMYVRSPGGILVECTANVPGGFLQDETPDELGQKLHLPPWYETQRERILAMLEPIDVPNEGLAPQQPAGVMRPALSQPGDTPGIALSRTTPQFPAQR